jgi:hypothetical protein
MWFNTEPLDTQQGWIETPVTGQQIVGVRSVLYSDGTSRRWYRMGKKKRQKKEKSMTKAEAKTTPISKKEATKLMQATKRRLGRREKETR